jgi:hypothetical protein
LNALFPLIPLSSAKGNARIITILRKSGFLPHIACSAGRFQVSFIGRFPWKKHLPKQFSGKPFRKFRIRSRPNKFRQDLPDETAKTFASQTRAKHQLKPYVRGKGQRHICKTSSTRSPRPPLPPRVPFTPLRHNLSPSAFVPFGKGGGDSGKCCIPAPL